MRRVPAMLLATALCLSGCFGGVGVQGEVALYDLPAAPAAQEVPAAGQGAAPGTPGMALHLAPVRAPGWLMTPSMQYRLAYADASRRLSYAGSRWVAPPAELVDLALRRDSSFAAANASGDARGAGNGCALLVNLDEFIQVFDAPGTSQVLVEARIALLAPGDRRLLAQHALRRVTPAGADARAGVAAFGEALRELKADLNAWLARIERDSPALAGQCRPAAS